MRDEQRILAYARQLADSLSENMHWRSDDLANNGGYWDSDNPNDLHLIIGRATAALEFFRQYAGPESIWMKRAHEIYDNKGEHQTIETGAHAVGDLLRAWSEQVSAGVVEITGAREWRETAVVSTDVMSQVRRLNQDRSNHPAAAIVLCGAALEVALRALADARGVQLPTKPTISTLSAALRGAGVLSVQDVKDIEALGGVRNSAAHGNFDELTAERAGLMEQHTNLLLSRLRDLHP